MQRYLLIRNRKRKAKAILVVGGLGTLLLAAYLFSISLSLFANTADYIVRPILGSRNTVNLESFFFGAQDTAKLAASHFVAPSQHVFANETTIQQKSVTPTATKTALGLSPIPPLTSLHPFPKEGVWQPIFFNRFNNKTLMAKTIVSPDPKRNYAYAAIVKLAMSSLSIKAVAGGYQPGGPIGNPGTGVIPWNIASHNQLIAAFNGGFQYKDGKYGMIVGKKVYVPLQNNLATFVVYNNGSVNIFNYQGQNLTNTIAVRQNGPMLIENGVITPYANKGTDTWGLTVTNSMYTWRSGIGVTKNGNLLYAVGPSLLPQTLAKALLSAGAVNAMQLDINPYWVRYVLFHIASLGTYTYTPLLRKMTNGGSEYLHGYQKDFFYIYTK